jgi:transcriptional regulator with XRE-family HTH domain
MNPEKLRALRKSKGLSQEDLALDLHESQNTISNLETGKQKTINLQLLYKIASYFNIEPYELLSDSNATITLAEKTQQKQNGDSGYGDQFGVELVRTLKEQLNAKDRQLDEKDRQILKLVELLEYNWRIIYFT